MYLCFEDVFLYKMYIAHVACYVSVNVTQLGMAVLGLDSSVLQFVQQALPRME